MPRTKRMLEILNDSIDGVLRDHCREFLQPCLFIRCMEENCAHLLSLSTPARDTLTDLLRARDQLMPQGGVKICWCTKSSDCSSI